METFAKMQTSWEGLWWNHEINCFVSATINLAKLKKFKGNVKLIVKKNKYFNGGENGRPNYQFMIKDSASQSFHEIDIEETEEERLYTREEVTKVMHGACRDGQDGYSPYDCLIEDYL